jgi:hypothetical protein
MEILIKPQKFTGSDSWESKQNGVVLVEKKADIEPLWKLLCEQDHYWVSYKNLIKVAPKEINSVGDISRMCEYCGKTDIYKIEEIRKIIPFIIYQGNEEYDY